EPEHRLARELRRAGREGIREDRTGSPTVRSRGITLASPPPSAPLRDEPARRVRSRRRPRRKRQARRRRRRRRLRLHPARSQGAGRVAPPGRSVRRLSHVSKPNVRAVLFHAIGAAVVVRPLAATTRRQPTAFARTRKQSVGVWRTPNLRRRERPRVLRSAGWVGRSWSALRVSRSAYLGPVA